MPRLPRRFPFSPLLHLALAPRTALSVTKHASLRHYKGSIAEADSRPSKETRQIEFKSHHIDPYPRFTHPPPDEPLLAIREIIARWDGALDKGGRAAEQTVTVTGRIHSKRKASSKLIFYDIVQDGKMIQAVASRSNFAGTDEEFLLANKTLYRGDIVAFSGMPGKTDTGQMSVFVTKRLELLSPCFHDVPRAGLKDSEKRFRNRHVDLLVNPSVVHTLETRSKIIKFIRNYLDSRDFLEVETPILSAQAGGANARPFLTRSNAVNMDMQLRIAPELYLKQLVIGGLDRVYELGKQFRNEGIDADHNPEFTTCEFYQAYGNINTLVEITEGMMGGMVQTITGSHRVPFASQPDSEPMMLDFTPPFHRVDIVDELERKVGQVLPDLNSGDSAVEPLLSLCHAYHIHVPEPHTVPRILDKLISHLIEPECVQPTFLVGHPVVMSPLAKAIKDEKGRIVSGRFELFVAGKEMVNAYEELNDPIEQRARFAKQQEDRNLGDPEVPIPDYLFCDALEFGLPPTAGWGMGVDRIVALMTGARHIREVMAFPLMKPAKDRDSV